MSTARFRVLTFAAVAVLGSGFFTPSLAQTINGTLMEVDRDTPISLGLIIMMTEDGDSITAAVTDARGRFRVEADEPGAFVLIASAFGFKETKVGIFDIGDGGSMDIEFRVATKAMPIDGILVELQRPAIQHSLIRNGYVRRLQRGLGHFITPYDIENSLAFATADLFRGIPGVAVIGAGGGGILSYQGDIVQMLSATGYCTPTIYLDGLRLSPAITSTNSLEDLVPLIAIDAAEIYRRPSEVPIEYSGTGVQASSNDFGVCGVLVLWTKRR